jgi:hypothetical protein
MQLGVIQGSRLLDPERAGRAGQRKTGTMTLRVSRPLPWPLSPKPPSGPTPLPYKEKRHRVAFGKLGEGALQGKGHSVGSADPSF